MLCTNMEDIKIFKLSWHYTFVIVPLILGVATIACYGVIEDIFVYKTINVKGLITIPVTPYLWYKFLTVPFKVLVQGNEQIVARSLLKKINISTTEVEKIKHRFFSSKIYYKDGIFYLTNLMDNFGQLVSILSSSNSDIIIEKST